MNRARETEERQRERERRRGGVSKYERKAYIKETSKIKKEKITARVVELRREFLIRKGDELQITRRVEILRER